VKITLSKSQWKQIGKEAGWLKDSHELPSNELELLSIPEDKRTWGMIEKTLDPDGKNHDLTLECVKCGNKQTCRCSKPKRKFLGVCPNCSKKQTRELHHSLDMHDGIGEDDGY